MVYSVKHHHWGTNNKINKRTQLQKYINTIKQFITRYSQIQIHTIGGLFPYQEIILYDQLMVEIILCFIYIKPIVSSTCFVIDYTLINKTEEYVPGVWPCFRCRQIPSKLETMQEMISDLVKTVNNLNNNIDKIKQENEKVKCMLKERDDKLEGIIRENTELRGRIATVSNNASADHWQNLPRPQGTLLVGSSLVRDIDENKLSSTKVMCIPGGKINDIKARISSMPTQPKLERVVLVVGGNDCSSRESEPQRPVTDLVEDYSDLIKCAREVAVAVTVSSVCPRNSGDEVTERIKALNAGLKVLCDDLGATFVDNDPAFHLQDGSRNDGFLLADGVHLTRAATIKLTTNLQLKLRHGENNAFSDHRHHRHRDRSRQTATPDTEHADATTPDDHLQHAFWQQARKKAQRNHDRRVNHGPPNSRPAAQGRVAPVAPWAAPRPPSLMSPSHWQPLPPQRGHPPAPSGTQPMRPVHSDRRHPSALPHAHPVPTQTHHQMPPVSPPNAHPTPDQAPRWNQSPMTTCQLCLGHGHSAVVCKSRDSVCYKCNRKGHIARACVQ